MCCFRTLSTHCSTQCFLFLHKMNWHWEINGSYVLIPKELELNCFKTDVTTSGGSRGVSGRNPLWDFKKFPEDLMEDALKLKFLEGSATPGPFFVVEVLVFQVIQVNCVRLRVLLLAKLNLLCLEMLVVTFFYWSSTNSELNFYKTRNFLLKITHSCLRVNGNAQTCAKKVLQNNKRLVATASNQYVAIVSLVHLSFSQILTSDPKCVELIIKPMHAYRLNV